MRSNYCGDLNESFVDQEVQLCGWVHRRRDHGGVIFLDVRDRAGIAQVVYDPDTVESFAIAEFDFRASAEPPPRRGHDVTGLANGTAHAVVSWFDLHLDDNVKIDTRRETDFNRWHPMAYRLAGGLPVRRGDVSNVAVQVTDSRFYIGTKQ